MIPAMTVTASFEFHHEVRHAEVERAHDQPACRQDGGQPDADLVDGRCDVARGPLRRTTSSWIGPVIETNRQHRRPRHRRPGGAALGRDGGGRAADRHGHHDDRVSAIQHPL